MELIDLNELISKTRKNIYFKAPNLEIKGFVVLIGLKELSDLRHMTYIGIDPNKSFIDALSKEWNLEIVKTNEDSRLEVAVKFE